MILWETDDRAISRAVQAAAAADKLIDDGTARAIASGYNEPGTVADFCTSGALSTDAATLFDAITDHGHYLRVANEPDRQALTALRAYLDHREENGETGPVAGWAMMWAVRHVDYPHAGVGDLYDCPPCEAIRADQADQADQDGQDGQDDETVEASGDPPVRPTPPGPGPGPVPCPVAGPVVADLELTATEHRTDRVRVRVELPAGVAGHPGVLFAYLNRHPEVWLKALLATAEETPVSRYTVDAVVVVNLTRAADDPDGGSAG